ncbi:MAG: hypothetical protein RLZZ15_2437 [Verrucomicrobiota bacterium]
MERRPTVLSTFSGLGGLDLGLESAGFRVVGCIESNEVARASLSANRPRHALIEPNDITAAASFLGPTNLGLRRGELTLLAGGPPCQPFSKAAQWSHRAMRGMNDPRSQCLGGFLQLIESFLPRTILIENVQGFVSGRSNAVRRILESLEEINRKNGTRYALQSWTVDAADFGVPQRRARAILFAERNGNQLSPPVAKFAVKPITAWDALCGLRADTNGLPVADHWARLLPSIPPGENYLWHTRRGGGLPLFGYRRRFWSFLLKLSPDKPAWTLPAQPGPYTGPFHWENRVLTIPEMLRLQSFPADWKVCGTRREQVRQVGNATPPLLAEIFGRAIREQLLGHTISRSPSLRIRRTRTRMAISGELTAVPKEFRCMMRDWPDHPGTGKGPRPTLILTAA